MQEEQLHLKLSNAFLLPLGPNFNLPLIYLFIQPAFNSLLLPKYSVKQRRHKDSENIILALTEGHQAVFMI